MNPTQRAANASRLVLRYRMATSRAETWFVTTESEHGRKTRKLGCSASPSQHARAFTLIELVVVLLIIVAMAGIVIPLVSTESARAQEDSTRSTIVNLRSAVIRYWNDRVLTDDAIDPVVQAGRRLLHPVDPVATSRQDTPQLVFLMLNPFTLSRMSNFNATYKVGWNGPYMNEATGTYAINNAANFTNRYGITGDAAFIDAWGRPIVIQHPGESNGVQDVRLVSAGRNGVIDIAPTFTTDVIEIAPSLIGDDIYVSFQLR